MRLIEYSAADRQNFLDWLQIQLIPRISEAIAQGRVDHDDPAVVAERQESARCFVEEIAGYVAHCCHVPLSSRGPRGIP